MSAAAVAAAVLLWLGVAVQLLACCGVLAMRGTFARLHYVGVGGFGVAAIALAILIAESFSVIADKALATAALVLLGGPALVHVTARTARIRRHGDWRPRPGESLEELRR